MNSNDETSIVIEVSQEGDVEAYAVSCLEDLWHDYLHFKRQAEETFHQSSSPLLHKRYLRVAIVLLQAYLEGVVNRFCINVLRGEGKSREEQKSILRKGLDKKCEFLWSKAFGGRGQALFDNPKMGAFKSLGNKLVHLKDDGDFRLFDSLSLLLQEAGFLRKTRLLSSQS